MFRTAVKRLAQSAATSQADRPSPRSVSLTARERGFGETNGEGSQVPAENLPRIESYFNLTRRQSACSGILLWMSRGQNLAYTSGMDKQCASCKALKPLAEFHRDRTSQDGRTRQCAKCKRERMRRYYADTLSASRARSTKKNRAQRLRDPDWRKKLDPYKRRARKILSKAVASGKVKKPGSCSSCGWVGSLHGHHADYSKPLSVEWLCAICHGLRHRTP